MSGTKAGRGEDGGRIARRFADLAGAGRGGLVTFVTAGDPDHETSRQILTGLPGAGADVIELGMPFSDPVADGPAIQAASVRALKAGATMGKTLDLVRAFRQVDTDTPVVLMGYFNPVYRYGTVRFVTDAREAGVDGLIIVDLPPEEAAELDEPAAAAGLDVVRLVAPTTDDGRLPTVLEGARGFVYYVSIAGVTGTGTPSEKAVGAAVRRIRRFSDLPVAAGFGIKTPAQAAQVTRHADAAVVGSALVRIIARNLDAAGRPRAGLLDEALAFVADLASGVRRVRERQGGTAT